MVVLELVGSGAGLALLRVWGELPVPGVVGIVGWIDDDSDVTGVVNVDDSVATGGVSVVFSSDRGVELCFKGVEVWGGASVSILSYSALTSVGTSSGLIELGIDFITCSVASRHSASYS